MADKVIRSRAKKPKGRTGCSVCKRRRLKCDEQRPSCQRCIRIGVECPGYARPVKWSTKYEKTIAPSQDLFSDASVWFDAEARRLSGIIHQSAASPVATEPAEQGDCRHDTLATDLLSPGIDNTEASFESSDKSTTGLYGEAELESDAENPSPDESGVSPFSLDQDTSHHYVENVEQGPVLNDSLNPCLEDISMSLTCYTPSEESSALLNYYFSTVCQVNSAFDSLHNPFRSEVSRMVVDSPLLYYCVIGMSAAHLYQNDHQKNHVSLQFQTRAISQLSGHLAKLESTASAHNGAVTGRSEALFDIPDDVLLGIILLGMTSTWHDVSATGLTHLAGSRQLFRQWMKSKRLKTGEIRPSMDRMHGFLVSCMTYWEAMSSFILDQDYASLSYLDDFVDQSRFSMIQPSPWTGVATPVYVFFAKTGALLRNSRALRKLKLFNTGSQHLAAIYSEILDKAAALEKEIVNFRLPFLSLIEDMGDLCTPPNHFLAVARCYRLAALLELYREFPELVLEQMPEVSFDRGCSRTHCLLSLALEILGTLEGIPESSGTIAIQLMALMIAGSALSYVTSESLQQSTRVRDSLNEEVTRWRSFVRRRASYLCLAVGLRSVSHGILILEEVWSRMDLSMNHGVKSDDGDATLGLKTHWLDVMSEKRLETIFG